MSNYHNITAKLNLDKRFIQVENDEFKKHGIYVLGKIVSCFGSKAEKERYNKKHNLTAKQIEALLKRTAKKHGIVFVKTSRTDKYGNVRYRISRIGIPDEERILKQLQADLYKYLVPSFLFWMISLCSDNEDDYTVFDRYLKNPEPFDFVTSELLLKSALVNQNFCKARKQSIATLSDVLDVPEDIVGTYMNKTYSKGQDIIEKTIDYVSQMSCITSRKVIKAVKKVITENARGEVVGEFYEAIDLPEFAEHQLNILETEIDEMFDILPNKAKQSRYYSSKSSQWLRERNDRLQTVGLAMSQEGLDIGFKTKFQYTYEAHRIWINPNQCKLALEKVYHIDIDKKTHKEIIKQLNKDFEKNILNRLYKSIDKDDKYKKYEKWEENAKKGWGDWREIYPQGYTPEQLIREYCALNEKLIRYDAKLIDFRQNNNTNKADMHQ